MLTWLRVLISRLFNLSRRGRIAEDFDEEIQSHLDLLTEDQIRQGMNPEDARRAACLKLGGITQLREQHRAFWGFGAIEEWSSDVRYSVRALRKSPALTGVAIFALALGIGANTAIFTLIDNILLKWLPVKQPEQLMTLCDPNRNPRQGPCQYCFKEFIKLRDQNTVLSGLLARSWWEFYINVDGRNQPVNIEAVSGNYFEVLGVNAFLGRTLTPADDVAPGARAVAVLTYGFWNSRFGGDRAVIGKTIHIQGHPFTIVGVTPPEFSGVVTGLTQEIRVPWSMVGVLTPSWNWNPYDTPGGKVPHSEGINLVARLKPGISVRQAQASLEPLFANILREHVDEVNWGNEASPARDADRLRFLQHRIRLSPLGSGFAGLKIRFSQPLLALMALVGVLLLIACSTLANLLLARGSARQKEISVRLALGAGRVRILRQSMIESLLLACAGGGIGVLIGWWGAGALVKALGPTAAPQFDRTGLSLSVSPDVRILAFTAAVSLLAALLSGLAPAVHAFRSPVIEALKAKGTSTGGRSYMTLRKGLIVVQVALCLLLLNAAGLFVRSLQSVERIDAGVDTNHLVQVEINPDPYARLDKEKVQQYYRELLGRIESIPGVRSAARSMARFMANDAYLWRTTIEGSDQPAAGDVRVTSNAVTSEYFKTTGIPLIAGRIWSPADDYRGAAEAVVSQSFVRSFLGSRDPLGVTVIARNNRKYRIVGVVGDSKYGNLRDDDPRAVYYPAGEFGSDNILVATAGDPGGIRTAIEREARALKGEAYVHPVKTLDTQMNELLVQQRLVAWLAGLFGALAAMLAAVGLYGVIAQSVQGRTQEFGLRLALGAGRGDILFMVLREVLLLVALGSVAGLAGALVALRLVASLLFGVAPSDAPAMLAAALLICSVATFAGYVPARRATRVDPIVALRYE
jgi:predicted permease